MKIELIKKHHPDGRVSFFYYEDGICDKVWAEKDEKLAIEHFEKVKANITKPILKDERIAFFDNSITS